MFYSRKGGDKWVDRGDPATSDKTVGDFTTDSAWHDLDLSAIVPANAKEVLLLVILKDDAASMTLQLREKGNANTNNASKRKTQVANVDVICDMRVNVNSSGIFEYWATSTTWSTITLIVRKWRI